MQPTSTPESSDEISGELNNECDASISTVGMMAEGDSSHTPDSMAKPQTARKDSRKVPGGFDADEMDDLSPSKARFDHDDVESIDAHTATSNRVPSLDLANLPSLPPESSLLYAHSDRDGVDSDANMDSLDEQAMRKHLMNIESSFLPALSPLASSINPGVDDTYLFDRTHQPPKPAESTFESQMPGRVATIAESQSENSSFSQPTPPDAYRTPAPPESPIPEDSSHLDTVGNTTSSLETMSSSPTAAAAARTVSRAISSASNGDYENARESKSVDDSPQPSDDEEIEFEPTPRKPSHLTTTNGYSSDERSTVRNKHSNASLDHHASTDAGSTPGAALLNRRSSGRRPKFLRSRQTSQRSSISSVITNPDYDENGPGADYALQSGGALPDSGISRESSYMLSRSISLGSMASGIEDLSSQSDNRQRDRALATLDEEERNRERKSDGSKGAESPTGPTTPRARSFGLAAPTDTVIARRVHDVQVPETIAREYRTKNRMPSPTRATSGLSGAMGRSGKNLTLKEQSSTIDRLSLENWDLKLRIMFLSDRLGKLSEEGVKEMVSENVDLKTALANFQRDNRDLRRKVKDLEKKLKEQEGRPDTARSGTPSDDRGPNWFDQEGAQEREEELIYLRERVEEYVTEIERLRSEGLARESEKRKMAETVRSMGEKRGDNFEAREEMDVWKDLLEQETARREQADEENRKLREEVYNLRTGTTSSGGLSGANHTTNIYHITKKRQISPSRPRSGLSENVDDRNGAFSSASTLADELRKESEQLRHENAELRREVGAQTSMLTSRNREKERLYQEIEDLKLQRRGGGSVAEDSIFERSISRARQRSRSGSDNAKQNGLSEAEREEYENQTSELRDKINDLRLKNQDLQEELDKCMEDFEIAVDQKGQAEAEADQLQADAESLTEDIQAIVAERDQLLTENRQHEIDFESLRREAQSDIDNLELEINQKNEELDKLQNELADRHEDFTALQSEMRNMSEGVVRLQDDQDAKMRRIQELEHEVDEASRELEEMEKTLVEANSKINRLLVQQESSQGEIAFLREEQDGDKIKIGDLEAAIRSVQSSLHEEKERTKELEQRLVAEREQRDLVAGKEKQEVQIYINELNRETSGAKDEARRLRKSLSSREVEATEWKMRLMELENNLREALGDLNGTRSSLLKSVEKLQRELESTSRQLDTTRATVTEKDRLIKQRDGLLESHGLETRKMSEMLDKERQSHRNTKAQFDSFQKTHQHTSRTVSQQETRMLELETSRAQDRKKIAHLENTFKDQLTERNNLLLHLWTRLSALCGKDWAHNNSLINGRALPTLEAVSTMLPGFSKNLYAAVKTLETLVGGFNTKIKNLERDLWKEYQNLEHTLDLRTKKLERLETVIKSGVSSNSTESKAELAKLKDANRLLKTELASLRNVDNRTRSLADPNEAHSPSPSVPTGPRNKKISTSTERTSTLTRHHSASAVETLEHVSSSGSPVRGEGSIGVPSTPINVQEGERRWIFRLKELEKRLKAEREARLLDRSGARKRLEEGEKRNEELRMELERAKLKKETALH